jgi:hypothetical protein
MKIIKIVVARQDKSGQTYTSQYSGKEQARVALQVDSPMYQGKWVSNFVDLGDPSEQWKEGQDVDIEIIPKGQYLNWKLRKVGQAQTQGGYAQLFEKTLSPETSDCRNALSRVR